MLIFDLKYGFISNYKETIFLQLDRRNKGQGDPCIFYSGIIKSSDLVDKSKCSVSLRLALFYLTHKTTTPDGADWAVSEAVSRILENSIEAVGIPHVDDFTPYGARNILSHPQTPQRPHLAPVTPLSGPLVQHHKL